jgi:hypothetical protein
MRADTGEAGYTVTEMADEQSTEIFDDLYLGLRAGGALRKQRRGEPLTDEEREALGHWQRLSPWRKGIAIGGFAVGTFGLGFTLGGLVFGRWGLAVRLEAERLVDRAPDQLCDGDARTLCFAGQHGVLAIFERQCELATHRYLYGAA